MKRIALISILIINSVFIFSQVKVKTTSLKFDGTGISALGYHVVKVVDERQNKEYIGQVQKGLANRKYPLNFKMSIDKELYTYLRKIIPQKNTTKPITVIVHQLWVSEKTLLSSEKAFMDITLEFRSADEEAQSLGTFSHFIEQGGLDVTNGHERRIREGILKCLRKFQLAQKAPDIVYQKEIEKLDLSQGYPENLKKGFYLSFSSLTNNDPIDEFEFRGDRKKVTDLITRTIFYLGKSKKKVKHYAYYSGKKLLLNAFNIVPSLPYFLDPHTEGRYIVYVDRYAKQDAAIVFGAIGAAASTKSRAHIIDMQTGVVSEANEAYMKKILAGTDLFGVYLNGNKKPENVIMLVKRLNERNNK